MAAPEIISQSPLRTAVASLSVSILRYGTKLARHHYRLLNSSSFGHRDIALRSVLICLYALRCVRFAPGFLTICFGHKFHMLLAFGRIMYIRISINRIPEFETWRFEYPIQDVHFLDPPLSKRRLHPGHPFFETRRWQRGTNCQYVT